MTDKILNSRLLIIVIIIIFTSAFLWYLLNQPTRDFIISLPGMDNRPLTIGENDSVIIGEFFEIFNEPDVYNSGSWPRFRGVDFNNISNNRTPVAESWPLEGPPIVWQIDLGEGHAGPAIHNGKVYVLDYDEKAKADALRVFSFSTGEELWRRWYNVLIKRNHGMSRSIPTVTNEYVITFGPRCHVMCSNSTTGDLIWSMDLIRNYGADLPQWYTAQCPLIDDSIAVIAIGGEKLAVGVNCYTGEIVWETPNPDNWKMSHSSVFTTTFHGKKTYVYMAIGGVAGISAEGDDVGQLLWSTTEWSPTVVAASPVFPGNNEIIVTTGYGAGGAKFRILKTDTGYEAILIEKHSPKEGLASEQQTPIVTGEYIWTINPKDAGALRNQLACYHVSDLTYPVWTSGKENRYGLGPYLLAGDIMFLMNDDSELFLYKIIDNKSAQLLAQHKVFEEGVDAWGPMAYIDGYLILRDSHRMVSIYVGL
ncbi:MAG: PQQ-binding-like beta-propeller repeat protein [Bacteroidetes bacterium]|nr:PQQ-binding-like beta-propeller repeat protein [Bacteroidota bacterium]MBL6943946.1 PQQ-binding-like beta-propeller repeat protein [Bacteroidales bacterium]